MTKTWQRSDKDHTTNTTEHNPNHNPLTLTLTLTLTIILTLTLTSTFNYLTFSCHCLSSLFSFSLLNLPPRPLFLYICETQSKGVRIWLLMLHAVVWAVALENDSLTSPFPVSSSLPHLKSIASDWQVAVTSFEESAATLSTKQWPFNERLAAEAVDAAKHVARQLYRTDLAARLDETSKSVGIEFCQQRALMADLFLTALLLYPRGSFVWNDLGVAKIHLNKHDGINVKAASLKQFFMASRVDTTPLAR
jgi:hypothetical protein